MRYSRFAYAAALLFAGGVLFACSNVKSKTTEEEKAAIPTQAELVKRGEYLVSSIGCDDCHSPKRMGAQGPEVIPELRFSGYPANRPIAKPEAAALKSGFMLFAPDLTMAVGPWGTSFAANITPHETGIGAWTEQNFLTAIKHGKAKGIESNRFLLPPMPWGVYRNLTDEDLKSIFAYLKSVPAIENRVPAPLPPAKL